MDFGKIKREYEFVIGLDEAGRGALAGPVVAGAVAVKTSNCNFQNFFKKIKDSKKLTPQKRKEIYEILKNSPQIFLATSKVSAKVIDKINILQSTKLAMKRAVEKIISKIKNKKIILILDGNFKIKANFCQISLVKADEKIFVTKAASILAKVKRDELMEKYHRKYPQYGFDRHKGYPTKFHKIQIQKHGLSVLHRLTFSPCKNFV